MLTAWHENAPPSLLERVLAAVEDPALVPEVYKIVWDAYELGREGS